MRDEIGVRDCGYRKKTKKDVEFPGPCLSLTGSAEGWKYSHPRFWYRVQPELAITYFTKETPSLLPAPSLPTTERRRSAVASESGTQQ